MKNGKLFIVLGIGVLIFVASFFCWKNAGECRILENASKSQELDLCYFDGERMTVKEIMEEKEICMIVEELEQIKARRVSSSCVKKMKTPNYGIMLNGTDGRSIRLTYSDGLWLSMDGTVYKAKYDFEQLFNRDYHLSWEEDDEEMDEDWEEDDEEMDEDWEENDEEMDDETGDYIDIADFYDMFELGSAYIINGGYGMVNADILCRYDTSYFAKAEEIKEKNQTVFFDVLGANSQYLNVRIQNTGNEEFYYDECEEIQKKVDGCWCILPQRFPIIRRYTKFFVPAASDEEREFSLKYWGELDAGEYRLVVGNVVGEFMIR